MFVTRISLLLSFAWDLGIASESMTKQSQKYVRNQPGTNALVFISQPRIQNRSIGRQNKKPETKTPQNDEGNGFF